MSFKKFVKRLGGFASNLPGWVGPAASVVTSLLGGKESRDANEEAISRAEAFQREFAQHGVRWRVEDAKAAGVHPVYALGAQLPAASPIAFADSMGPAISEAGQNIASGIAARGTRQDRLLAQYTLAAAKAQLRESDARIGLLEAETALARNQAIAAKPFPSLGDDGFLEGQVVDEAKAAEAARGLVEVSPAVMPSRSKVDSGLVAGTPAGMREFELPGGFKVLLPSESQGTMSEAVESVSESILTQYGVLAENVRHYGWNWFFQFLDRYLVPGNWMGTPGQQGWGSRLYDAINEAGRRSYQSWPRQPTLR